jgi:predicted PhzF superfamily epimerase YddE/YHI9
MKYIFPNVNNINFTWKNNRQNISRDNYQSLACTDHFSFTNVKTNDASKLFDAQLIDACYQVNNDLLIVLNDEQLLINYRPDIELIKIMAYRGVCITSKSKNSDYSNRFFAPAFGVNEDYVTASAHNYLSHYWSNILNKKPLKGSQLSPSMGVVNSIVSESKVTLTGQCYLYSRSSIYL